MRLEQAHQSHININMDAETPVSAEEDKVIDILKDLDEQSRDRYRSYWENRMVLNLFYGMQLENIKRGQPMSRTAYSSHPCRPADAGTARPVGSYRARAQSCAATAPGYAEPHSGMS